MRLILMHMHLRKTAVSRVSLFVIFSSIAALYFCASQSANAAQKMTVEQLQIELKKSQGIIEEQNDRLEQIEEVLGELDEKVGSRAIAHAFEAKKFTIGGFLHATYTTIDGDKGSANSFNRLIFELLARAQLNDEWSAFVAQAFIREADDPFASTLTTPTASRQNPEFNQRSKAPLVIAWVNYQNSDALNVQIGRFITPLGIINIEHFPASLLDTEQPLFLRPFGGNTLFPNFMTGLHVHGKQFVGNNQESTLSYHAFTANFAGNPGELVYGGRVAYEFGKSGFTLGGNVSTSDRGAAYSDYNLTGVDLLFKQGKLLWKSEVFSSDEDLGEDRLGWYTQPAWYITPKWIAFYRHDFLDDGSKSEQTEDMLGVNFLPYPNIRLRATLTAKDFDASTTIPSPAADATILQFSGTFSF